MIVLCYRLLVIYKYLFTKVNDYIPACGCGAVHICAATAVELLPFSYAENKSL